MKIVDYLLKNGLNNLKTNKIMKQTAVEWLFRQLWDEPKDKFTWYAILKQAKTMEKEQIEDAWTDGMKSNQGYFESEQYYNETFIK
jgi:hypothetical protein